MESGSCTGPKITYWVPKFLLLHGCVRFGTLGATSPSFLKTVRSQDEIGWREILEGMVSKECREIQRAHYLITLCRMAGDDWMKQFVTKILRASL